MRKVDIHEAQATLSQLIKVVEAGQDVVIARAGRPVVRLTRVRTCRRGIKLGTLQGMFKKVSPDFDAPLPFRCDPPLKVMGRSREFLMRTDAL
jgi:prevent-host-death family protein